MWNRITISIPLHSSTIRPIRSCISLNTATLMMRPTGGFQIAPAWRRCSARQDSGSKPTLRRKFIFAAGSLLKPHLMAHIVSTQRNRRAMSARGTYSAERILRQGEDLLSARKLSEALDLFQRAEIRGADADSCAAGRWMVYMLLGHFELAWSESDAIRRRGALDPHRFWQGEALRDKRVILRCLHGFGDAVQFLRYVPQLRDIASRVMIEVPPRFRSLAPYFDGVEEVITWGDDAPMMAPEWDVQIESNELPFVFRTQLNDLPLATNYLKLSMGACNRAVAVTSRDVLRVGLSWTAGAWHPKRSVPVA